MSTTLEVGNDVSPLDNLSAALAPEPFSSTYIFSEPTEDGFALSLHPLRATVDASISSPSTNFGHLTDPVSEPVTTVMGAVQSDTGSVVAINRLLWDNPTHEPKTISGGTFISGNVNYIHATVVPPSKIPISIVWPHFYLAFFRYLHYSSSSTH
jgi:hypothetical protein